MTARIALLSLPIALAACAAPGPTFDQRMATFVGRGEGDLVANLGVPVRTYETEGRRFLQFEEQRTILVPGDPWGGFGPWGYRRVWAAPPSYAVTKCEVTFALRQNRVEGFTSRGEACN